MCIYQFRDKPPLLGRLSDHQINSERNVIATLAAPLAAGEKPIPVGIQTPTSNYITSQRKAEAISCAIGKVEKELRLDDPYRNHLFQLTSPAGNNLGNLR